ARGPELQRCLQDGDAQDYSQPDPRCGDLQDVTHAGHAASGCAAVRMVVEVHATRVTLRRRLLAGLNYPYLVLRLGIPDNETGGPPPPPRLATDQVVDTDTGDVHQVAHRSRMTPWSTVPGWRTGRLVTDRSVAACT